MYSRTKIILQRFSIIHNWFTLYLRLIICIGITIIGFSKQGHGQAQQNEWCTHDQKEAYQDVKQGNIYYIIHSYWLAEPRYVDELRDLLKSYSLILEFRSSEIFLLQEVDCYREVMDSVIIAKHGANFRKRIESRADSLFAENRNQIVYSQEDVDERVCFAGECTDEYSNSFMDSLNATLDSIAKFEFSYGVLTRSHFIIRFTVDSLGDAFGCSIVEEVFMYDEDSKMRQTIRSKLIKEVNKLTSFQPATLLGYKVNSEVYKTVAFSVED